MENVHSKGEWPDPQILNNEKTPEAKTQLVCKLINCEVKLFNWLVQGGVLTFQSWAT